MKQHGLEHVLAEHPLFRGFDDAATELLAGCARNEQFKAGELIYREGDPAEKVYILRRGDVAVEISSPERPALILETLHAGDVLGWSWMVPPYRSMSDARAVTPVSAVSLDAGCVRTKCDANPAVGYAMFQHWMPHLAARIRALRMQLLDLYGPKEG